MKKIVIVFIIFLFLIGCGSYHQEVPVAAPPPYEQSEEQHTEQHDEPRETISLSSLPSKQLEMAKQLIANPSLRDERQWERIPTPPLPGGAFTPNGDGLIEIVSPENLLWGRTPEEWVEFVKKHSDSDDGNIFVNDEGHVTTVYSLEKLGEAREYSYQSAQSFRYERFGVTLQGTETVNNEFILFPVLMDAALLTEIIVLTDAASYASYHNYFNREGSPTEFLAIAAAAGRFQVASGVAPDEWHVTVTVADVHTGEVINTYFFPNEDMWK